MNTKITHIVFSFLLILFPLLALTMEITEIVTPVDQPYLVEFLYNDNIVVAGLNGFTIVNYKTQKPVLEKIDKATPLIHDIAVNNDKTQLAISQNGMIVVYNANTGELLWQKPTYPTFHVPIVFNSQNKEEVIAHIYPKNILFLHPDNETKRYKAAKFDTQSITPITCYPYKTKISYIANKKNLSSLRIFDPNPMYEKKPNETVYGDYCLGITEKNTYVCHAVSPNNCHQALINNHGDLIIRKIKTITGHSSRYYAQNITSITDLFSHDNCSSGCIAFHPNGIILAFLTSNYTLEYWNCRTSAQYTKHHSNPSKALLKQIPLSDYDQPAEVNDDILNKRIAFSPKGQHVVIALNNKCLVLTCPYEMP